MRSELEEKKRDLARDRAEDGKGKWDIIRRPPSIRTNLRASSKGSPIDLEGTFQMGIIASAEVGRCRGEKRNMLTQTLLIK